MNNTIALIYLILFIIFGIFHAIGMQKKRKWDTFSIYDKMTLENLLAWTLAIVALNTLTDGI